MKEPLLSIAWEPNRGRRFSVVHGTGIAQKYNVSFYNVEKAKVTKLGLFCLILSSRSSCPHASSSFSCHVGRTDWFRIFLLSLAFLLTSYT